MSVSAIDSRAQGDATFSLFFLVLQTGMLIGFAGLVVQFLLLMEEAAWKQLVSFYMEKQITSLDAVLEPDSSSSAPDSRGNTALGKDLLSGFADLLSSRKRKGEKCHPPYGCFSTDYPWTSAERPLALYPESSEVIRPVFCLYTRRNPKDCYVR
ncbi:unnamed protein product [Darwinula stevensoni]|uniref:Uncharacterized protein n=1 Tax=Darwinula stevensoni TaxID=69355 RepID=A0A7R8XCZ5_9CRUS|nr:unnamed protein product [Darwinula stevensoni]CAG0892717.1 unnamed protein product [Darwinula stevensoni]